MNTRKQPDSSNKLAILPMWVIDRIKEEMRLGPAAWQAITEAVEKAEVPQALPCEVKLPPGTVIGQSTAISTLMLAIQQRASYPAKAQVFSSVEPEQPHPEPIAWMVGTAIWWTKEEAERDAAETGLPIVGLGPMTDTAEVERLREALKFYADRDHFAEDIGSDWDSVSGEPANVLWHENEAWFVEDGSIARAAMERRPETKSF